MSKHFLTVALLISLGLNLLLFVQLKDTDTLVISEDPEQTEVVQSPILPSGQQYPFIRVVDGDTVVVGFEGRTEFVRLIGIDSPEPNDPGGPECYADEATDHLRELMQTGTVVLHFDESQGMRDTYGRLLAYVELPDGTDLGEAMVADGYAREFTYDMPYTRIERYKNAEQDALTNERGLWSSDTCVQ